MHKMAPDAMSGNRLTPPPDARVRLNRDDQPIGKSMMAGWLKENVSFVRQALENKLVLEGYSISEHQAKIDRTSPPKPSDAPWRNVPVETLDIKEPTAIVGSDDAVAIWVFPEYFKSESLIALNRITTDFAISEMGPFIKKGRIMGAKANGKKRGAPDSYTTSHGLFGSGIYCSAWHPQGHKKTDDFAPSKDMLRCLSVVESGARQKYFTDMQGLDRKVDDLVSIVHPKFYNILEAVDEGIQVQPACRMCKTNIKTKFPGRTVICNRQSGEHTDSNGVRRGTDVLYAAGDFDGGEVYFKDLSIRIPLKPGTLLLFDGTSQRHSIDKWSGPQRFSFALFVHTGVAKQLSIDTTLCDVTVQSTLARLNSLPSAKKRARSVERHSEKDVDRPAKKKPSQGKGKFSKSKPAPSVS